MRLHLIHLITKRFFMLFLILLMGTAAVYSPDAPDAPGALYARQARQTAGENVNYYLGVLADGFPTGMVVGEFKAANARVVNIKDKMIIFGITGKTKLTTFMKNLPFLEDVYTGAADLKTNKSLRNNPLTLEFLHLLRPKRVKKVKTDAPPNNRAALSHNAETDKYAKKSAKPTKPAMSTASPMSGNMAVIDKLIREKAKKKK